MISSKDIVNTNPKQNEITAIWDPENIQPCCKEFPINLKKFLITIGRPTKLKAIARWDLPNVAKYQREIRNAGFSLIQNPYDDENSSDKIIKEEIMINLRETLNLSHLAMITGDGDFVEILQSVPDTEIILVSNPFITSSQYIKTGFQIIPLFNICDCEISTSLKLKWLSRTDLDACLMSLFLRFYQDPSIANTLSSIGRKIREDLRPIIGELDWKLSKFTKMKDIADELVISIE